MAVSARTRTVVWAKAGGHCSLPECRQRLIVQPEGGDASILGELAHIVAQQPDGPRGGLPPPGGEIDGEGNLVLLCPTHHTQVDKEAGRFTIERLVQVKTDHERWVTETLSPRERLIGGGDTEPTIAEEVYSTLLPVVGYPRFVYAAACSVSESEVREQLVPPSSREVMLPYIVRSRQLFSFVNLRERHGPFYKVIDAGTVEKHESTEWWSNDDLRRWYVALLNRSLNKLTGRRGLRLDKEHHRYYFEPQGDGEAREIRYRTLTGKRQTRKVAWQPVLRHSGEKRKYWEHLAVGIRFTKLSDTAWVLSIRPERRFTRDGFEPITPKGTGRRATSRKSRMYNEQVLREVNFWRDFLSDGRPRLVFNFGEQSLMVQSELLSGSIEWPGVPDDARPFTYTKYEEDLFTQVELDQLEEEEQDD